jgi:cobalt-zinc-cadmium efflux system protein
MQSKEKEYLHSHLLHHSKKDIIEKRLLITIILNFVITLVEVGGGLISNSLALLSDAFHNLGDGIAVLLAYIAHRVSKKESNERKTFGYKRIEILVAFINSVFLVAICFFLIYQAIVRFYHPEPIKGLIMLIVAGIGLIANLAGIILLKHNSSANINVRAAYLHLLGDTLSSVIVIAGGFLIYFFNIYWLDPLITIIISLYIIKETYTLLKDSVNILMQSTPQKLDLENIKKDIESLPEVLNIHHIHAWGLNEREIYFEGHIDINKDLQMSETDRVRKKIELLLAEKYQISHFTLQMEFRCCDDTDMIHHKET